SMSGFADSFAGWWLHSALCGGLILLVVCALAFACRQPAWKQRLGEWGMLAALVVAVLSLSPPWMVIAALPVPDFSQFISTSIVEPDEASQPSASAQRSIPPASILDLSTFSSETALPDLNNGESIEWLLIDPSDFVVHQAPGAETVV